MTIRKLHVKDIRGKHVHLVGIGGSGMSGIARIMASEGVNVSGSDSKDSSVLSGLRALGVKTIVGHSSENILGADFLVYSTAISRSNPEIIEAERLAIPRLSRAQALAILMSESTSVAVAGTHGKTTTTSMLTVALQSAGEDPSFAIGGVLKASGSNAHKGSGSIFIAEADESDGSFIEYHPYGAIITNIEHDHVDFFETPTEVAQAFAEFASTISSDGFLVYCRDDTGATTLAAEVPLSRKLSYGTDSQADLRIDQVELLPSGSQSRVLWQGLSAGKLNLQVPGFHNVLNAAGALTAGLALGVDTSELLAGLSTFRGTSRRFEFKGQVEGIRVIDDYGHHPTEIRVTLDTAKRYATDGRVLVVFQPHRYSRTRAFTSAFATALDKADQSWVLEIYGAGEATIPGVSGSSITKFMTHGKFEPNFLSVVTEVAETAQPGDVILTLGAGDVSSLAPLILDSLSKKYAK
ncbi:MAG: UDP-N-acetylmuramate--L-alanine ligase [Actinobacteria bacterium]|nr:UDP-N-acetylmuramate--L-alanine ligase [Actinomycetota bacterium]